MITYEWTPEKAAALDNIMLSLFAAVNEAGKTGVVYGHALRDDMAELANQAREISTVLLWAEKHRGGK